VVLTGLVEAYFAIRVGFDAALFHHLSAAAETPVFGGVDAALTRLGLRPAITHGRSADARVLGAKRLLRLQLLAFVAEVVFVLFGACMARTWR
jgi:hypothetical protein